VLGSRFVFSVRFGVRSSEFRFRIDVRLSGSLERDTSNNGTEPEHEPGSENMEV